MLSDLRPEQLTSTTAGLLTIVAIFSVTTYTLATRPKPEAVKPPYWSAPPSSAI